MDLKWLFSNQLLFLYGISFLTFSSLFGVLWAVVLLISIELIENNFEFDVNVADEPDRNILKETTVYLRNYSLSQDSHQETNYHKETMNRENERKQNGMLSYDFCFNLDRSID